MNQAEPAHTIKVLYFDGQVSAAHEVKLSRKGQAILLAGPGIALEVPVLQVTWPERTRHGLRVAHLRSGGSVQALDNAEWDTWMRRHAGLSDSLVVKAQQSWRWALLAAMLLMVVCFTAYKWGLPLATKALIGLIPPSAEKLITESTLQTLDQHLLEPSKLPFATQQQIAARFGQAVSKRFPHGGGPAWALVFRDSRQVGPNAFALPNGTIVITDALCTLLTDQPDVMLGVLGHELGHVQRRHAMRGIVQASVVALVSSLVLGDISTTLAAAPVLLGQMAYSRDFEREADDEAIEFMRANSIRPSVMTELFARLASARSPHRKEATSPSSQTDSSESEIKTKLGIAFSSHPADQERIAHFIAADQVDQVPSASDKTPQP